MAKLGRILLIAMLVLLALMIIATVAVETRWARGLIEEQISQRMDGRAVQLGDLSIDWGFPLGITAANVSIANPEWAEREQMISVDQLHATLKVAPLLRGQVALGVIDLQRPQVHLARREDGTSNWAALMSEEQTDDEPSAQPDVIRIENGVFTYRDEALDADISLTFATQQTAEERRLQVTGTGNFQGQQFDLNAQGGAPAEALEEGARYPVNIDASLGDMQLVFQGESLNIYQLQELGGHLSFNAPDQAQLSRLSELFNQSWLNLPPLEIEAELHHAGKRWALDDIQVSAGSSQLSGSAAIELTETPRVELDLDSERLDLNQFGIAQLLSAERDPANRERGAEVGIEESAEQQQQEQQQPESFDARIAQLLDPLRQYAGEVDIQIAELVLAEARLERLAMKGSLDAGRLQIDQLDVAQGSGGLQGKGWVQTQEDTLRADLGTRFDNLDLGQALQPFGMEQLGIIDGDLSGAFDGNALRISDTELSYQLPEQELRIEAQIVSREIEDSEAPGARVEGHGSRGDEQFSFDLTMGPLLDLRAEEQPYPIQGSLISGDTKATIDGTLIQPLELKAFDIRFDIAGPNPAALNPVTGLSLPDLSQYQASGRLRLENGLLRATELRTKIGESDLDGELRFDFNGRPMLWATLHSDQLNTRDLIAVGRAADESDEQAPEEFKSGSEVFDHEPLDLQVLGRFDAQIRYQAANIQAKDVPLNDVSLVASLDEGVLRVQPLSVGLGGGSVNVEGQLNAREPVLQGELSLSMQQVNLTPLLQEADLPQLAKDTAGILGGKGQLRFAGESIAELMAGLDGVVELAMSGGYLDSVAVEVVGFDAGEALLAAVADDQKVPLRCTYAKAVAEDGLVTLKNLYINTADTNILGSGTINLATEELDLVIRPHAKDFSLLSAETPVQLQGHLGDLKVNVVSAGLLAKGAASVVGALLAPPLAILPWVEPGTGENVGPGCEQALREYQQPSE